MKTNFCPDCHMPRPNHSTGTCPGWDDSDDAALEAKREAEMTRICSFWRQLRSPCFPVPYGIGTRLTKSYAAPSKP
jgi:hypothetical protein